MSGCRMRPAAPWVTATSFRITPVRGACSHFSRATARQECLSAAHTGIPTCSISTSGGWTTAFRRDAAPFRKIHSRECLMAIANPSLLWRKTNAPFASSRTDDIWFATPDMGWAVNSNGQILKTEDGGNSWVKQLQDTPVYLRCVGFAGAQVGWAGTVSGARRLFATRDGGANWKAVDNLPAKPAKVCGISVVDQQTVYASGTNDPKDDPAVLRTRDGGATWDSIDMS